MQGNVTVIDLKNNSDCLMSMPIVIKRDMIAFVALIQFYQVGEALKILGRQSEKSIFDSVLPMAKDRKEV